ncbi:MAG: hypothetical protein OK454_07300 [Thaumarchaeota archaeon]|nr:hypothetical protein [Nitrososphaerota archaeon]
MSDFSNYRRDLSVLDAYGGRVPQTQRDPPSATGSHQIAPWMSSSTGGMSTPATVPTSLYNNDSSDNLSPTSQLSPAFRPGTARPVQTPAGRAEYPDAVDCDDERRPSIASVTTTASSQASKTSGQRGGFRKLQGFFGEEFPGKDSSETSLPTTSTGKEQRSQSYSHSRPSRDRNHSNATDSAREASPVPSRPRTPVPAPEVVPFLYQEADVS